MSLDQDIIAELQHYADPQRAAHSQRFFKTGKGEYGENDLFWGVTTPQVREIVKKYYKSAPLTDISALLHCPFHEARAAAVTMLAKQFAKADAEKQKQIVDFYVEHLVFINNWDLVDISAPKIIGPYCVSTGKFQLLYDLASSGHLWSERVALVSNWYLVRQGYNHILQDLALQFLNHPHDLIHKALGWMLREMGKQNQAALIGFLDQYASKLPRTALRYALEKLMPQQRRYYLQQK